MKLKFALLLVTVLAITIAMSTDFTAASSTVPQEKVQVCHKTGNGSFHLTSEVLSCDSVTTNSSAGRTFRCLFEARITPRRRFEERLASGSHDGSSQSKRADSLCTLPGRNTCVFALSRRGRTCCKAQVATWSAIPIQSALTFALTMLLRCFGSESRKAKEVLRGSFTVRICRPLAILSVTDRFRRLV